MKFKSTFFIGLLAALLIGPSIAKAQPVSQGAFTIDAYYGFPNLMTTFFKAIADPYTDGSAKGLGPFGAKVQYLVGDHIGLGLDFFYASSSLTYTDDLLNDQGNLVTYDYTLKSTRPRILLRADFHFGASDVVDPYLGVGLGYSASKYSFITNDPNFDLDTYYTLRTVIPVAYRLAFGTKFYFAKFLGAGVEVGIGGPLLTFGLSGKFGG